MTARHPRREWQDPSFWRRPGVWVAIIVLVGVLLVGWKVWQMLNFKMPAFDQRVSVQTGRVAVADVPLVYEAPGGMTTAQSTTVRTEILGQVIRLGFTEGQVVQQGQLLAQLQPRIQQAETAQALAQLQSARQGVASVASRRSELEATLQSSLAEYNQADRDFQRFVKLFQQDVISRQELETARTRRETALAAVEAVKGRMAALKAETRSAQAQIGVAQAGVGVAGGYLQKTRIVAPFTGRVGIQQVEVGSMVMPGDPIVSLVSTDQPEVAFEVPGELLFKLKTGLPVRVLADDATRTDVPVAGTLTYIAPALNEDTGTVPLKARVNPAGLPLRPGQLVQVQLSYGVRPNALVVPESALVSRGERWFVYGVDARSKVHQITVTPHERYTQPNGTTLVAISATGLVAGDRIVIDGVSRLDEGAEVFEETRPSAGKAAAGAKE